MRIIAVTQARMGSTRLPAKIMRPLLGEPMLVHHLRRLGLAKRIDGLVVATTDDPGSAPIVDLCDRLGIPCFRGSETDVLARFHGAAEMMGADLVVRVTSDCPLLDPVLVDAAIERVQSGGADYASVDIASYPRGCDAEAFTRRALDEAFAEARAPGEREHVTPFIYRRPARYRLGSVGGGEGAEYRFCVDEAADFQLVEKLAAALAARGEDWGWQDCVALLRAHPDWAALNRGVAQKSSHA
jgi:spore coat polysaccharide biosynthesis protein SpsF